MSKEAKEKAQELVDKFRFYQHSNFNENKSNQDSRQYRAKQCALICVDEILSLFIQNQFDSRFEYYQRVKEEIIKL